MMDITLLTGWLHLQVDPSVDHFTSPEGEPGKPETNFNNRPNSFLTGAPPRTVQVRSR
jgi:1,4-alpha-glucan branching enzyme